MNSLLILVEEDILGIEIDRFMIVIKGFEDSDEEWVKENKSLIEKRWLKNIDFFVVKRERRGGIGRIILDEKL